MKPIEYKPGIYVVSRKGRKTTLPFWLNGRLAAWRLCRGWEAQGWNCVVMIIPKLKKARRK